MPKRTYKKPLKLDMDFGEALERFARVDPRDIGDMVETQEGVKSSLPEIMGREVSDDEKGNICLTDFWEIAGKPANLRPSHWHRQKRTEALEAALQERIVFLKHTPLKDVAGTTYYVKGKGGASKTYAHPVLALAYAEDLLPALGVVVREVFLRYRADDISLANEILDRIAEQIQEDEYRIHNRAEQTIRNRELASQGKCAGCTELDYAELHNSGYRGLYNGLDAIGIHKLKKLTKNQKILDHMGAAEGAANVFRVTQAKVAMQTRNSQTPQEAFVIAHEAGVETRKAMARIGGVMPEDLPVADNIKDAKKRLETNKQILKMDS